MTQFLILHCFQYLIQTQTSKLSVIMFLNSIYGLYNGKKKHLQ